MRERGRSPSAPPRSQPTNPHLAGPTAQGANKGGKCPTLSMWANARTSSQGLLELGLYDLKVGMGSSHRGGVQRYIVGVWQLGARPGSTGLAGCGLVCMRWGWGVVIGKQRGSTNGRGGVDCTCGVFVFFWGGGRVLMQHRASRIHGCTMTYIGKMKQSAAAVGGGVRAVVGGGCSLGP